MKASEQIKNFIKAHEGLRLATYRCPSGVYTIGYGHTGPGVTPGKTITRQQADELFDKDISSFEDSLNAHLSARGLAPSQRQYDALLSFTYNTGIHNLLASTLWKKFCTDPADSTIAGEFRRWVYGGGKKLPGLVKRRHAEALIYTTGKAEGYE